MAAVFSKSISKWLIAASCALSVSACSSWIFRIDVPQGNYLEQKEIDKLRIAMTKEQVQFVLGNPVADNSFDNNVWHYFYALKRGNGEHFEKKLILTFVDNKLTQMAGDFETPAQFNTALDQ